MNITILDGNCTIGGNKIMVEEKNETIFLDFGMNFSAYAKFFEEFLTERVRRGIYDLWRLDLIPKRNIYRKDLIPDDLIEEITSEEKIDIKAVLISHAHLDHVGNIALLDENVPIIASPQTLLILKALSDISTKSMGMEIPFYRKRESDGFILSAGDIKQREIYSTEKLPDETMEFLQMVNAKRKEVERKEIRMIDDFQTHFNIKPHAVDHSILGANAFIIEGDTTIAYTGDFRIHGMLADETRDFIKRAKEASILIIEGTRLGRENDINVGEKDVYLNALNIVNDTKNLVIADFSARNFERLISFKEIARKTGRKLVITDKDAYHLYSLDLFDNGGRLKDLVIYDERQVRKSEYRKYIEDHIDNEWVGPEDIRKSQENYIVCFSFFDINELLDIVPKGGSVYIYSSSEAFGEEDIFSFERLMNWIDHFNLRIEGVERNKNGIIFKKGLHASGHISESELYDAISFIDPDVIIPVHTENREWFVKNFGKKIRLPEKSLTMKF